MSMSPYPSDTLGCLSTVDDRAFPVGCVRSSVQQSSIACHRSFISTFSTFHSRLKSHGFYSYLNFWLSSSLSSLVLVPAQWFVITDITIVIALQYIYI